MEIVKPIIRVGNSAGVILPREWLNGEARVTLVRKPQSIKQEILEILGADLSHIIGLYLVGSYARGEQDSSSDIDVLGITDKLDKRIKKGKYEIILISKDNLEGSIKENALPLLPMLKEALPIINKGALEKYQQIPLTKKSLKWHIETTLSALKLIKESIALAKEKNEKISDNIAYSLFLRLREIYIVNCLIKNSLSTTAGLMDIIKKLSISNEAYMAYKRSKSGLKARRRLDNKEAETLYNYIFQKVEEQGKWIRKNG